MTTPSSRMCDINARTCPGSTTLQPDMKEPWADRPEGRVRPGTSGRLHPVPGQVLAALARALDVTASPRRAMAAAAALRGLVEGATTR
jgi:hypothetical protein